MACVDLMIASLCLKASAPPCVLSGRALDQRPSGTALVLVNLGLLHVGAHGGLGVVVVVEGVEPSCSCWAR